MAYLFLNKLFLIILLQAFFHSLWHTVATAFNDHGVPRYSLRRRAWGIPRVPSVSESPIKAISWMDFYNRVRTTGLSMSWLSDSDAVTAG